MLLLCVVVFFRTAKNIKPLNSCEIPPERIESLEEVGQGAFGKVHKAKLIDGLEFFNKNTKDWCEKNFKYKIRERLEIHLIIKINGKTMTFRSLHDLIIK